MSLSKVQAESIDLTATYAFTGTVTDTVTRNLVLLQTLTASSSATLSFTSGIDNTYQSYVFKFINIHGSEDRKNFLINFRDGGSNFDATKTTTFFQSSHKEDDSEAQASYNTGGDLAQSTSAANLDRFVGNDADQHICGELELFDPSSTTFVKHFMARSISIEGNNAAQDAFLAGYCNVTAAVDGVQFSMSSGNIDSGTIKMYGVL
jgi:hypothetical protein